MHFTEYGLYLLLLMVRLGQFLSLGKEIINSIFYKCFNFGSQIEIMKWLGNFIPPFQQSKVEFANLIPGFRIAQNSAI